MFAFPQVLSFAGLTGVPTGIVEWPWLGAFFAWTLVAALVGIALGFLRDFTRETSRRRYARPTDIHSKPTGFTERRLDREAA